MKRNVNKTQLVKDYLLKNGSITQLEAYEHCCYATRLSAIIFNLRSYGWIIDTVDTRGLSGCYYAKYVLVSVGKDIEGNI